MTTKRWAIEPWSAAAAAFSCLFFAASSWASYARWANFDYRTFDLAYYAQALWQLVHGRFELSIEAVPLLGNHVEPIVFLMVPFFILFRHPMTFVLIQNAALAVMGPLAFNIARRLGLNRGSALLLAIALLVTPATGYVALHEFHPEAMTAPCLLLMVYARLRGSLRMHWAAAIALLACKENMALLLAAYSAIHLVVERKRPAAELRGWYVWPLALSVSWFLICTKLITPTLNSGAIDYLALYDRLGTSAGDILIKSITEPGRIATALSHSLAEGNMVWALLVPFLGLSLLRPHWLLIGLPILLQHLLSWRSSEWQIYFHYAAPLIPLFWVALAEALAGFERGGRVPVWIRSKIPFLVLAACVVAQIVLGPAGSVFTETTQWRARNAERARKIAFVNQISPAASVVAPLPYLSHLAMREKVYSLHYILKGLKTLSRSAYDPPPPTDFVLIDYNDPATFDPGAGYYHPAMKTVDGRVIPSSDRLLHDFLKRASWTVNSSNELTLFRQSASEPEAQDLNSGLENPIELDAHTKLNRITIRKDDLTKTEFEVVLNWSFQGEREFFPWMLLKLTPGTSQAPIIVPHGLCAPERTAGPYREIWRITASHRIPPGEYQAEAVFLDYAKLLWTKKANPVNAQSLTAPVRVSLGEIKIAPSDSSGK